MKRSTIICSLLGLLLAAMLILGCTDGPVQQVDYCDMTPKPLICP